MRLQYVIDRECQVDEVRICDRRRMSGIKAHEEKKETKMAGEKGRERRTGKESEEE